MANSVSTGTASTRNGAGSVRRKASVTKKPIVVAVAAKPRRKAPDLASTVTMQPTRSMRAGATPEASGKTGPLSRATARPETTAAAKTSSPGKTAAPAKSAPSGKPGAATKAAPAGRAGTAPAKTAPAKALPPKALPTRAGSAAKQSSAERPAGTPLASPPATPRRTPSAVRSARGQEGKAAPARPQASAAPQRFTVSHLREDDFKPDGLRPYARYRDLGIAQATGGLAQAHVIRFVDPPSDLVRKRHQHTTELQLVYVLKGWVKNEFEGVGEQMMSAGSCWIQPPGIPHTVLDYSPDVELLEIVVPADFDTTEL